MTPSSEARGNFFVPADGPASPQHLPPEDEDDEPPPLLLPLLTEHLSLCLLSRSRTISSGSSDKEQAEPSEPRDIREWDKLIISYLVLLAQWLWDEPGAVREFLENGGVGMVSTLFHDFSNKFARETCKSVLLRRCIMKLIAYIEACGTNKPN